MSELPPGTITLLFTHIEGSTALWKHDPAAMPPALARHTAILQQTIAILGGAVFYTGGDAVYAAFPTAPAALAAALAAQRQLQLEAGGEVGSLRVGMALHTGTAELPAGQDIGALLNHVARLLSVGHGGQILLSAATQSLVRTHLPAGVALRDLGSYHLPDLPQPEPIFQLIAPDLPADFPPLRTLERPRSNLPSPPTLLLGREREVAACCAYLRRPEVRLLTLTGPGGIGKTRLAVQVAAELREAFAAGVCFVDLAPLRDPELVVATIIHTLGLQEVGRQPPLELLTDAVRDQQLLLVLDNFEQVAAAAPVLATVLAAASRLKLLVTSREGLHLSHEYVFEVPPLALPDRTSHLPLVALQQVPAVALFVLRAQASNPSFQLTEANAVAVAALCQRVDGLPLAIELAAAHTKVLSPQALLTRLEQRLTHLSGGARDLPPRQRTLRNTIDWSYTLLNLSEQRLFTQLAVFVGGWTLEAAEAVCAPDAADSLAVLEGLQSLVDKHLVQQAVGPEDDVRFTMLAMIREYAWEQLEQQDTVEELRRQHAAYYLALAEQAEPALRGPQQLGWLHRFELEHDNLRAALDWWFTTDQADIGLQMATTLWLFWHMQGHVGEGYRWLERGIARRDRTPPHTRAKALNAMGLSLLFQGDYAAAQAVLEEGLQLYRAVGDPAGVATAVTYLGLVGVIGQRTEIPVPVLLEEALRLRPILTDRRTLGLLLLFAATSAAAQGDWSQAVTLNKESVAHFRAIGDIGGLGVALTQLGLTALAYGDDAEATALLQEKLRLTRGMGDRIYTQYAVWGLAGVALHQGQVLRAVRLWAAADAIREAAQIDLAPGPRAAIQYDRDLARARAQLNEDTFTAAWMEGQAMPLEQAISYALERMSFGDDRVRIQGQTVQPPELVPDVVIDEARTMKQVAELTETAFFRQLQAQARTLRQQATTA